MKCFYGCGNEATYVLRNKNHVCHKTPLKCPEKAKTMRENRALTLKLVGDDGLTGLQRNAFAVAKARKKNGGFTGTEKMINTKRNNIIDGKDLYQRTAEKTAKTRFGVYTGIKKLPEYKIYRYYVDRFTKLQPLHLLPNFERRAGYGKSLDPYQLDHKFSVTQGFLNNIPPYIIAHISNLEMLPSKENNSKGGNCSITKEALYEGFFSSIKTQK